MNLEFKVIGAEQHELISKFEQELLSKKNINENDKIFIQWKAPWRDESLAHYLKTGWCMAAYDGDVFCGYFLAQPFLFFGGMTQTLWIEHIGCIDQTIGNELILLAYKYAKDKHMQRVLFNKSEVLDNFNQNLNFKDISNSIKEVSTAKYT